MHTERDLTTDLKVVTKLLQDAMTLVKSKPDRQQVLSLDTEIRKVERFLVGGRDLQDRIGAGYSEIELKIQDIELDVLGLASRVLMLGQKKVVK